MFEYATQREAMQAAWGYAKGQEDAAGDGPSLPESGVVAFGRVYGGAWARHQNTAVGHVPSLADAWRNWRSRADQDLPLSIYVVGQCERCGVNLTHGKCLGAGCIPPDEQAAYEAFHLLAEMHRRRDECTAREAAGLAADDVALFGKYPRDGESLRHWITAYSVSVTRSAGTAQERV